MISVCIPTYNGGKYIEACLQSIYAQTFTDFEIIICDDCSTDNTLEIIKSFQQKDSRIKVYINEKNLGLVGNWNRCIELASGEWIKFVFQDDLISPTCLHDMLAATNNNTNMVVCEREFIFEKDTPKDILELYGNVLRLNQLVGDKEITYVSVKQFCAISTKYTSNFIGEPTSLMFRKSITEQIGFFNTKIAQLCDYEYSLRIGFVDGFVYIPTKLTSFRVHSSSTTQKNNAEKYFTSSFSDKILVLCFMLYDGVYKNFRKQCTWRELYRCNYNLFYILYHANIYIKANSENKDILNEMESIKRMYPKLKRIKHQYLLHAPVNICIRYVRKIASFVKGNKQS